MNKKKKRISKIVDFAVPDDHRVKLKESEKKDKSLNLARPRKWRLKPITINVLGTVTKELLKGLGGHGNNRTSGDYPNYYTKMD